MAENNSCVITNADISSAALISTSKIAFAGSTIADLGSITTVDINGGSIDGVTVGATMAATGRFTALSVSDGDVTNVGDISLKTISANGTSIFVKDDLFIENKRGVVIGASQQYAHGAIGVPEFQVLGTNALDSEMLFATWSDDRNGPLFAFTKSRGTTIGATPSASTRVQEEDVIGKFTAYADDGTDTGSWPAQIVMEIDGPTGVNDVPGRIRFLTASDGASGGTEALRITSAQDVLIPAGSLFIGPSSSNANMQVGLTINQNGGDNDILALKSTDVDHKLTSSTETDTFLSIRQRNVNSGGALISVISEHSATAPTLAILASGSNASTGKGTSVVGLIDFAIQEHDGAGNLEDVTSNGNIFSIRARVQPGGCWTPRAM